METTHIFTKEELALLSLSLKCFSIDMVQSASSGHPGMPMGMADITAVLAARYLNITAKNTKWINRDRLVLSNGHGSALQYSLLHFLEYKAFNLQQIKNFRQLGYNTHGHPEFCNYNGIETTTGPLGQGVANAVGMAIAARKLQAKHSNDINYRVYCYAGDGCIMEGITQEAISIAGHLGLSNLVLIYDNNGISIDGSTNLTFSENIPLRFESANWHIETIDGHDYSQIDAAFQLACTGNIKKPILINAHTKIAHQAPTKEGKASAHGAPLGEEEIAEFKKFYSIPNKAFYTSPKTQKLWIKVAERMSSEYHSWVKLHNLNFEALHKSMLEETQTTIPQKLEAQATKLAKAAPEESTRKASSRAIEIITESESVIVGSADLTDSNCIRATNYNAISILNPGGNFIHYGVREHAMAAIANGIALSGCLLPLGATFLMFTDYMRPALRLSCIMNLKVIYVATHDSIGLGEDGPTHQPVEQLPSLRIIPNLNVLRPADSCETLLAYNIALQQPGPVVIALSRQNLPSISSDDNFEDYYDFGAKVVLQNGELNVYKVVIFATGSEVSIAMNVSNLLAKQDVTSVVISVLNYKQFALKCIAFERKYIGKSPRLKVAIEAAAEGLWPKIIGSEGLFFGVPQFGASGKIHHLYKHFKLTEKDIAKAILEHLSV